MKRLIAVLSVLSLLFFYIEAYSQIVEEDLSISEELISSKYDEALKKFNSFDQQSSIIDFNEIIVILEAARKDKTLSPSLQSFLIKSYDMRSQAYFNIGDQPKSESDILAILNYNMDYIPSNDASVKYLKNFEVIKNKMTGYYSVVTKPTGAKIFIDDKMKGYSITPVLRHRSGIFTLKAVLDGYETAEKTIEINSGQTTRVSLDLKRISAALLLQTCPNGVEVFLNEKYFGTTSGSTAAVDAIRLKNSGLDPEKCSSVLNIPNIPLGKYRLDLKKTCYQDSVMNLDISQPEDYILNPISLPPSQGELILKDTPQDAEVVLNGQPQGRGSVSLKNLCSGPYTLIVKFQKGKYLKQFVLRKDETIYVTPSEKTTLLFGGVYNPGEEISFDNTLALQTIAALDSLQTINIYIPNTIDRQENKELYSNIMTICDNLDRNNIEPGAFLQPAVSVIKDGILAKYESELLLIIKKNAEDEYQLLLFLKGSGTADSDILVHEDNEAGRENINQVVQKLDNIPLFQTPWLGLFPIEPLDGEGLLIAEVRENSPALQAGIQTGDRLLFLNERRMTDSRRYTEVLGQLKHGDNVSIKILHNGVVRNISIKTSVTTIIPRFTNGVYYLNRILSRLDDGKVPETLKDPQFVIPFLKAVLYYYLNANDLSLMALDSLKEASSDTLDLGLVELFRSLIYSKMGDNQKASEEKQKALKYPDSRLYDKSGTPISLIDKYMLFP